MVHRSNVELKEAIKNIKRSRWSDNRDSGKTSLELDERAKRRTGPKGGNWEE